jgi:hypothetical protein|tara:strand:- start:35 stop:859 length:825 start_codon:yes stop_codon:yes gene_type:complete
MIDSNILISLIIQVDKNDKFEEIERNVLRLHNYLKKTFVFYEIILIPNSPRTLSYQESNNLINSLTNLVIINPLESIDEDLGIRIGVENSIGEKVLTCFSDTSLDDLDIMIKYSSDEILIGVSNNKDINNILLLDRSSINILLNHYDNKRTFIFTVDLFKLPFKKQFVKLSANPRKSSLLFKSLKILRLLYNDHFLKVLITLEVTAFLIISLLISKFPFKYLSVLSLIYILLIVAFLIIFLITTKLFRKNKRNSKINYDLYKSNFNFINKLNIK